jgi:hypothetical protein
MKTSFTRDPSAMEHNSFMCCPTGDMQINVPQLQYMYIYIRPEYFLKCSESREAPSELNFISAYYIHLLDMDFP